MQAFEEFLMYKNRIPVRGAIMLNHAMDSAVLVKGWKKQAAWSFPRGKISKDEDDLDCAIREVYEETGFDIREAGLVPNADEAKYIDIPMREQHIRLYVFRDVPMDTNFEPRTRKEISKIDWFKLADLPAFRKKNVNPVDHAEVAKNANKFYMVAPFLVPLKKWVQQQKQADTRRIVSNGNAQYDDIQTEEEGFKSSIDAADSVQARNSSQRLDTMEGATAALQQLLEIQPPTQGLQSANSPSAPAVLRNTGNDLLALLRGKAPVQKPASPPQPVQPQQNNGFPTRQPQFNMPPPPQQLQPQHYPGPHTVLDQPRQLTAPPIAPPARDMRPGQFMMPQPQPQPFPGAPVQNGFAQDPMPSNFQQQLSRPPPGMQQPVRQPLVPGRDARSNQMQRPSSNPHKPVQQPSGHRRTSSRPKSTDKPLPFRPTAILARPQQAASREVTPQPTSPLATIASGSGRASPKRPDVHDIRRKQAQRQDAPPAAKPFAPKILKRPETKVAEMEAAAAAAAAQPQPQPQPRQTAPDPALMSPPITAAVTAALSGRQPSFTATQDLKNDLLSMFKAGKAAAPATRTHQPQQGDLRSIFKAPEEPKPIAPQQKQDLLSMIKAQEKKQVLSEQKADLLSLLKSPNARPTSQQSSNVPPMSLRGDRRPSADGFKADLLAQFKAPERRPSTGNEQKDNLLAMFKAPEMKKTASQSSQQGLGAFSNFLGPERRPSSGNVPKDNLLSMFRAPEMSKTLSQSSQQKQETFSRFQAPDRRPSVQGPDRRSSVQADNKMHLLEMFKTQPKPAPATVSAPPPVQQQKADLISLMRGRDTTPAGAAPKHNVFDLSRFRSPDARSPPAAEQAQHRAHLISMLSSQSQQRQSVPQQVQQLPQQQQQRSELLSMFGGQNQQQPQPQAQPQQHQRNELLSMFNGQQRPPPQMFGGQQQQQQQPRGPPVDQQKAHLLSLMGGSQGGGFGVQNQAAPSQPQQQQQQFGQQRSELLGMFNGQQAQQAQQRDMYFPAFR